MKKITTIESIFEDCILLKTKLYLALKKNFENKIKELFLINIEECARIQKVLNAKVDKHLVKNLDKIAGEYTKDYTINNKRDAEIILQAVQLSYQDSTTTQCKQSTWKSNIDSKIKNLPAKNLFYLTMYKSMESPFKSIKAASRIMR